MTLNQKIGDLLKELDRLNLENSDKSNSLLVNGFPNFVTSRSGVEINFSENAVQLIRQISDTLLSNDQNFSNQIEINEFCEIVRQSVADIYSENAEYRRDSLDLDDAKSKLTEHITLNTSSAIRNLTHYIPANTLGLAREKALAFGPIIILNIDQWLENVRFPKLLINRFSDEKIVNSRWKKVVRDRENPKNIVKGLPKLIIISLNNCNSLVKIQIKGFETNFSKKIARLICKTSLDAISLILGQRAMFNQITIEEERLPPLQTHSIIESNNHLWLPSVNSTERYKLFQEKDIREVLKNSQKVIDAITIVLNSLVDPNKHKHPNLANRWSIALDWFAEANRETNDGIALAKIASSLDILSCVGKRAGITVMLSNLLEIEESTQIIKGNNPQNLKQFVKKLYDDGRSKILHGSYANRLDSYSTIRVNASNLTRLALLEAAIRLQNYKGQDVDKAFRSMQAKQ